MKHENINKQEDAQLGIGGVSGLAFSIETTHRFFMEKMVAEISFLAEDCFHPEFDPEVCWKKFREQLRQWKKEHEFSYLKYLETDAD